MWGFFLNLVVVQLLFDWLCWVGSLPTSVRYFMVLQFCTGLNWVPLCELITFVSQFCLLCFLLWQRWKMSSVTVENLHISKSLPRIAGLVWSFLCGIKGNFWHFAVNACVWSLLCSFSILNVPYMKGHQYL